MKGFDREPLLQTLADTHEWDLLVIGGGATGIGIAVDAASRGFKTLLAEQADFAKGTSGRSTKLVHGGVRYLAQGNLGLVKEALKERGILLKNAPHLVKNESFIIPCFSIAQGIFYSVGLRLYDWLAGKWSFGKSKWIWRKAVIGRLPTIKTSGLKCGVLYHDGAFDDARLALNLAQTAIENGAVVLNYFQVIALQKNDHHALCGASIQDLETGKVHEVKAKVVVNATGVFADDILKMDAPEAKPIIRPSQGVHIVLDKSFLNSDDAIMIPHTEDGRVLFVIPWHGEVLIGTTDTPLSVHSPEPRPLEKEIDFVLRTAGKYLDKMPSKADVLSVFAGLRPLAATGDASEKTKEISRSHKVIVSASGLVSVIGGKWTTYRKMAEDTMTKIINQKMLPRKTCVTENLPIHGHCSNGDGGAFSGYGSDKAAIEEMIKENGQLGVSLSDEILITPAQIIWAVKNEMARTVEDVLARRVRVLFLDARLAGRLAPKVAAIMKDHLHRNDAWARDQVFSFQQLAKGYCL